MGGPSPRRMPGVEIPMPHLDAKAGIYCLDFCTPRGGFCAYCNASRKTYRAEPGLQLQHPLHLQPVTVQDHCT